MWNPTLGKERVQSHDMLYKMSRDILYTLRAGLDRLGEVMNWHFQSRDQTRAGDASAAP